MNAPRFLDVTFGFRLLLRHRTLVLHMLQRSLAARYRGSVLGIFWSFANPLLMLSVYTFVFGIVFKARWGQEVFGNNPAAFPLLMFCGMAVFNIFSESVNSSPSLIVGNPSFVKKVIFPLEILPICNVITSLVFGLVWFALLFAGTVYFLDTLSWTMLLLPLTLLPVVFIAMGVSLLLASLGVYLRDIQQLVAIATQVLFFMTPIFYPVQVVPEKFRWVLQCNPLSIIVEQTRALFLFGQVPDGKALLLVYGVALVVFQLGLIWFVKIKKGFADVL